jgi:hypothetical protein
MGAHVNAVIHHFPDAGDAALPDRKQLRRIAAGIAISLAVHALLLSSYRHPRPAALPARATEPLTVRLQAPPEKLPAAEPAVPAAQPGPRARPASRPRPKRRIIAVPPPPAPSGEEHVKVDTQPEAPRFNLDAARSVARQVANEPDPARVGTALERLPPPPLQTETKLERAIKAAKRPNCKDGIPGGLLAPLYLMMDKKDSGCKW